MKEIHFQPSRKINLNITVKNMRNSSRGLSYYKAFTPQTIGKHCLLLYITKSLFLGYLMESKKGNRCDKVIILTLNIGIHLRVNVTQR